MDMITPSGNNGNIYELKLIRTVSIKINGKEIKIMNAVLDEIFRQLKNNKRIDTTNMDSIFINAVKDLVSVGLLKNPISSSLVPYCNYYDLLDEDLLNEMIRTFEKLSWYINMRELSLKALMNMEG